MNAWQSDGWRLYEVAAEHRQQLLAEVEADRIAAELKRGQGPAPSRKLPFNRQMFSSALRWLRSHLGGEERPVPY